MWSITKLFMTINLIIIIFYSTISSDYMTCFTDTNGIYYRLLLVIYFESSIDSFDLK